MNHRGRRRTLPVLLALIVVLGGCGTAASPTPVTTLPPIPSFDADAFLADILEKQDAPTLPVPAASLAPSLLEWMTLNGVRPMSPSQVEATELCRKINVPNADNALGALVAAAAAALGRRVGRTVPQEEVASVVGFAIGAAIKACPQVLPILEAPRP